MYSPEGPHPVSGLWALLLNRFPSCKSGIQAPLSPCVTHPGLRHSDTYPEAAVRMSTRRSCPGFQSKAAALMPTGKTLPPNPIGAYQVGVLWITLMPKYGPWVPKYLRGLHPYILISNSFNFFQITTPIFLKPTWKNHFWVPKANSVSFTTLSFAENVLTDAK